MKVLAINGSPRKDSNTELSLKKMAEVLSAEKIETEIVQIGNKTFSGCRACGGCASGNGCVIKDGVNEIAKKMAEADGIIIGSPVYYAGINGTLKVFLDRAFYSSGRHFRFKPCAGLVTARRAGTTAAFQTINQYFEISEMMITPGVYWNGVHGRAAGEAEKDLEGIQTLSQLAKNMAYLIKLRKESKIPLPEKEERVFFNFIREQ